MTTVLIIVALMLVGSAVWGFWGSGLARGVLRTKKSKAGASAFLADDPRSGDSFGREQMGGAMSKRAKERFDPEQHRPSLERRRGELDGDVAARPSWREYIPLAVLLFFLWIFDTETWLQRTLLLFVALVVTLFFILMAGRRRKEERRRGLFLQ
jgi:hypothetical protein